MYKQIYNFYNSFGEYFLNLYYKNKVNIINPVFINEQINKNSIKTLLIVCSPGFNENITNANYLIRIGFAKGWSEKYGKAVLVSIFDLEKELNNHEDPVIFISCYDFTFLKFPFLKILRKYKLFVWVSVHPRKLNEYEGKVILKKDELDFEIWRSVYSKILYVEPNFVWNSCNNEKFDYWYRGWVDDGLNWQTMHPAIDNSIYFPDTANEKFKDIKISYVGGYWQDKSRAFDEYLRKYEEIFFPFGYSSWPYKNYSGKIKLDQERKLYSNCGLIPLVTSPSGWLIGEITERYFKAPACKAFCIADENPTFKDIFQNGEFLISSNKEEFHHLVNEYLLGKIDSEFWRKKGYEAVIKNHLYSNRAEQIISAL